MSKIESLYKEIGGNYEKARIYVPKDEMLTKYLKRYNGLEKVALLRGAISEGNLGASTMWVEEIYEMALTLSLTPVVEKSLELTKKLKGNKISDEIVMLTDELEDIISNVHKTIKEKLV